MYESVSNSLLKSHRLGTRTFPRLHSTLSDLLTLAASVGSPALADGVRGVTITRAAAAGPSGCVAGSYPFFVHLNAAPSGAPSCATETAGSYTFVIDPTTPSGNGR